MQIYHYGHDVIMATQDSVRTAFCLFCDDIRMEVGNKPSFMGVYTGGEMVFPPGPPIVPKLGIAVWLLCPIDDYPRQVTIRLFGPPDRTEILKTDNPLILPHAGVPPPFPDVTRGIINVMLPVVNLPLPHSGTLELEIETEREILLAGRLKIVMPTHPEPTILLPTASPLTAEQSPSAAPASESPPAQRRPSRRRSARTPAPE